MIADGVCKRIGNGVSTFIWADKWIPSLPDSRLMSVQSESSNVLLVSDLIVEQRWDEQLLCNLFAADEVATILAIPLCNQRLSDEWVWKFDLKGLYTVRSNFEDQTSNSRFKR